MPMPRPRVVGRAHLPARFGVGYRPVVAAPGSSLADITADIVIVGAGFAGLAMAIALDKAGRHDYVILEKASAAGGTWRENTYPGCACDIRSLLYCSPSSPSVTGRGSTPVSRRSWATLRLPSNSIRRSTPKRDSCCCR